jgi:hypothetical protein
VKPVRFLHCSDNRENHDICLKRGLAGFTISDPGVGDMIYILLREGPKTYCAARGILQSKTPQNPWPDKERFVSVFTIDWKKCKPFQVAPISKFEPRLKPLFFGKAYDILQYGQSGIRAVDWLNLEFLRHGGKI